MATIFITGGTGSLGSRFIDFLVDVPTSSGKLHHFVVFSRDEQKQYKMTLKYSDKVNISYVLGDVRDQQGVMDAIAHHRPDIVVHTAAQKHVQVCEHNPMQTVLTNIHGTKHVVRACLAHDVKVACFVSTDKSVVPTTLYGMTKNIAEQIWANAAKKMSKTQFVGVRYGNILNSAGSLIPLYSGIMKEDNPVFPVTDSGMTRFFITFNQAIGLIIYAIKNATGETLLNGDLDRYSPELYTIDRDVFRIPKLPSIKIIDIADLFAAHVGGEVKIIGAFESEKLGESMVRGYDSADGPFATSDDVYRLLVTEGLLPESPEDLI